MLTDFIKMIYDERMLYISKVEEISAEINNLSGTFSKVAADTPYSTFKKAMYYCTDIKSNPMFLAKAQSCLSIPTEMILIHYMMRQFLFETGMMKINTNAETYTLESEFPSGLRFSWNIPVLFFPVLISYIRASSFAKKTSNHIQDFFNNIHGYLNNISLDRLKAYKKDVSESSLRDMFHNWVTAFFKEKYFQNLNSLYTDCGTSTYIQDIRKATSQLTYLILYCPLCSDTVPQYLIELLLNYKKTLTCAISSNDGKNINVLCEHEYPYILEYERSSVEFMANEFSWKINKFYNFLNEYFLDENNHNKRSNYPLSIHDYAKFEDCYKRQLSQVDKHDSIVYEIEFIYDRIHQDVLKYSLELHNRLKIKTQSEKKRINDISDRFVNAYTNFINASNKLLSQIEKSSDQHPERYSTDLRQINLDTYKEKITTISNELYDSIKKYFGTHPSYITFHSQGAIFEYQPISFPIYESDIIRIIHLLAKQTSVLTDEYIISSLKSMNYQLPIYSAASFMSFLKDFKNILSRICNITDQTLDL